jgi:hypothetical protein
MLKDLLFKLTAVLMLVSMTNLANGQGMSCDMAEVITAGTYTLSEDIPANGNVVGNGDASATGSVWYSYTAAESGLLDVNSCLGGGDTRLWIHTGDCVTPVLYAGNDDACAFLADGSGDAYASSVASMPVAAGVTYIMEWDDRWDATAFTFNVVFTPLPPVDIAAAGGLPYTRYPDVQAATGVPVTGVIGNLGSSDLTGAVLTANAYSTSDLTTPVWTMASEAMDLAIGAVADIDLGMWTPAAGQDDYVITYTATANEEEAETEAGNNMDSATLSVKKTYAFDNVPTGGLGNPDSEIWQGNNFTFAADDVISSVTLEYSGDETATLMNVVIYSTDPETGAPVEEVYAQAAPNAAGGWVTVDLDESFAVSAGDVYFVGLHSITVGNVGLGTDDTTFRPGNSWLYLAVIAEAWINPEAVNFLVSYAVRVNMEGDAMYNLTASVDMANETVAPEGVFLAGNFNGWDASVNMMTDDDGDGIYTATVSVPQNSIPEYKFVNGGTVWEDVPAECALAPDTEFLNRFADVLTFDVDAGVVCFAECGTCPIIQEPCTNPDAVLCDNIDTYTVGDISSQSDIWTPWPGATGASVSTDQAQSGTNSMLVSDAEGADQVLLFPGNVTTGNYTARWSYYVPAGTTAYFNLQGDQDDIGGTFKMECIFNGDGTGTLNAGGGDAATFTYPEDQWFDITHFLDFDNDWIQLVIDGAPVYQWLLSDDSGAAGGVAQVGAVNFYPNSAGSAFYVDDVEIVAVPSCADASIICDPLESYFVGKLGPQSSWWSTWSGNVGGDEDGDVSLEQSNGGEKSLKLTGGNGQDVILLLGNQTEGRYRLSLDMYMEDGFTGYYNIQEDEVPAVQWNLEVFADGDGTGRMVADGAEIATFTYTSGTWVNFENIIDVDNATMIVNVDGAEAFNGGYIGAQIGSVNLYPADAAAVYYVDNLNFSELEPIFVEPDPVSVTMTVETSYQTVDAAGMFIAGSFNGWTDSAMTDNGDDTWSYTATGVPANSVVEYKFKNGPDGWESIPAGDCVQGDDNNRFVNVEEADVTMGQVCFNTCVATCDATNTIDVEFDSAIAVTPNPTNGVFTVSYQMAVASDLNIRVANMLGQVVALRTVDNALAGTEGFDLTSMPAGTYTLVTTTGERMSTKRIILQ